MFTSLKKWWKYMGAKVSSAFNEKADPKIQLEQAITEAQDQHRRLKEQAANVIANQKQTEMRLNAAMDELEKYNRNAQQAVIMADEAARSGDATKAAEYTSAAEAFANQLIAKESEIENLKTLSLQSTQAADQAKAAVNQNARLLQEKLAEKQKLLSQLDQAKMAEQMNTAMSSLTETVGGDVPTLAEVREKIETRYAKAKGMSEIQGMSVETKMLEVEQASVNFEAQARLSEIRSKLGISDTADGSDTAAAGGATGTDAAEPTPEAAANLPPSQPPNPAPEPEPPLRTLATPASPSRGCGRLGGSAGQLVSTTRSSRCTTSPCPSDRSIERRPAMVRSVPAPTRHSPFATTRPFASQISTASSAANVPRTSTTPAASNERPPEISARTAPSSTTT